MKYLPALAALLSLAACAFWIASLSGPWYHTPNRDGTEQHMGLYGSCKSGEPIHQHGHNSLEDAMGITDARQQLAQRDHDKHGDEEYDKHKHHHKHGHGHRHWHGHHSDDMDKDEDQHTHKDKEACPPPLQPIIIQPTLPPHNINAPTTAAPLPPQPSGPGDLQTGGGGGGGFGGFGGGGGGGMMEPTPGPTGVPVRHAPPGPTPFPASKHGHRHHDDDDEDEEYESMSLNQVSGGGEMPETDQGTTQGDGQGHRHQRKKHGKHDITRNNEFPYDETWVMAIRILLILAILASALSALLQLLMAWNVGRALYKGSWTTSPTTAMITTALITLAGIHGLITLFIFLSHRKEFHHGGYDYGYTLNIIATILSFISPILFWFTLDTSTTESLLGEETSAGRRKYASVE